MALLSIIVPVFNAEMYLQRCITSILRSTFTDWELILIDDGSQDSSGQICDQYSQADERVVVLHQPNQGQSVARNNGLRVAKGDYVTFVDADDEISDDAYLFNVQYLETHPEVDFLQYPTVWNCNTPDALVEDIMPIQINGHEAIFNAFIDNVPINYSVWNKIFRREAISDVLFVSGRLYEDKLFLMDVIRRAKAAYLSTFGEYHYYQYTGSSINKPTYLRRISWVESEYALLKEMYQFPVSKAKWLKRWMDTNRYLAVTHCQFSDEDITAQKTMIRQTAPRVKISFTKYYFWYLFILLFGADNYIKYYCSLLDRTMSNS